MPRSVNHVASKARRKKILKLTRGYFGARKNVWASSLHMNTSKNFWVNEQLTKRQPDKAGEAMAPLVKMRMF